ncbi:MAG: RNA polymerase sigma factor [Sphingomonas sp.]
MADDVKRQSPPAASWLADLFKRERPRAARRIRRHVADAEEAADVVQDAFERLVTLRRDDIKGAPEAYLRRVIRNLVVDRARRARCRPSTVTLLDEIHSPSVAPEQEDALEVEDLYRQYRDAVGHLTPRTREVFILHRVDELTYTEIAARLGISVSTVEYHIMRALVHLDEALRQ